MLLVIDSREDFHLLDKEERQPRSTELALQRMQWPIPVPTRRPAPFRAAPPAQRPPRADDDRSESDGD